MNREITFSMNDIDSIYVYSDTYCGRYDGKRLFAGRSGEDEATRLNFKFGPDFEGCGISVKFSGADSGGEAYSDTEVKAYALGAGGMEFSYDIPAEYMIPEVIKMVIEAESGDQRAVSPMIRLEVER